LIEPGFEFWASGFQGSVSSYWSGFSQQTKQEGGLRIPGLFYHDCRVIKRGKLFSEGIKSSTKAELLNSSLPWLAKIGPKG
jgi:hypothetical protein